jgi:hypothetical protein
MSGTFGIQRPTKLDGIVGKGMAQGATVESIFEALAAEPSIRRPIQEAIDNPPRIQTEDGKMIDGPSPDLEIRKALMNALNEACSTY